MNNSLRSLLQGLAVALCLPLSVTSCEEEMSDLGSSTIAEVDKITLGHDTIHLSVTPGYRSAVYVRTGYPMLGSLTDPTFGYVKAGYLAQFYASPKIALQEYSSLKPDSLIFNVLRTSVPASLGLDPDGIYEPWDSLVGNTIDSLTLRIYYDVYYGDSLVPQQITAYSLNDDAALETRPNSDFYSNTDYTKFYDHGKVIGRKTFTAADRSLSDSVRGLSSYQPYIEIRLDEDLKNGFLKSVVEASIARDKKGREHYPAYEDIFRDIQTMRKRWMSGVAIQSTFGQGAILKVSNTAVYFFYRSLHRYDKDGTLLRNSRDDADSSYVMNHVAYMAVTPDVVQMSQIESLDEQEEQHLSDPDVAYITSPRGYYSKVDLPVGRVLRSIMDHEARRDSSFFLSGASLALMCEKPQGPLFSSMPPARVLMVQDSVIGNQPNYSRLNRFFEDREVADGITSSVTSYTADSVLNYVYYYNFGNISSIITGLARQPYNGGWNKQLTKAQWAQKLLDLGLIAGTSDADLDAFTVRMAVVPVEVTTSTSYGTVLSVSNQVLPSAIRVSRNPENQVMQYIYSLGGGD